MKPIQRVVWSEGMFMSPQHLQQADAYHEGLIEARVAALASFGWGVVAMEIDQEALAGGQLQLRSFFGILPDGLPLRFEAGDPEAPPARPVEAQLGSKRSLAVYLGVPAERPGLDVFATADAAQRGTTRFTVSERPVADQLAASSVVQVAFGQRNVRLLLGDEGRDDYECIKVAEVVRDNLGALKVNERYVPPCLRIGASPGLMEGIRKALRVMLAKQRELSDQRRHRDAASLEFTTSDVTRYLQLNTLNGLVPVLNHLGESGELHPHALYLALLQAAGQLATFTPDVDPTALPKFQFTDLAASFWPLLELLGGVLRTVAAAQSINIPLESRAGGIHVASLQDEQIGRCRSFVLAVRSELPEQDVARQLPQLSKIASPSDLQKIVQAASPGVPLEPTFRPPPEVPVKPGVVYFNISAQDPFWRNAVRDQMVAIYLPRPFDPSRTKIELHGVPPAPKR